MRLDVMMAGVTLFVAGGGILFEIFLGAFGSYLFGDSVRIFGLTTGTYLFFMGVGAFIIRPGQKSPLQTLLWMELGLLVLHLISPLAIWVAMVQGTLAAPLFWASLALSGTAVGTEIPLVLALMREREGTSDSSVHWVLASDYLGALAASVLFAFFLLPRLGLFSVAWMAALLAGLGIVLLAMAYRRQGWLVAGLVLSLAMAAAVAASPQVQEWLERKWYSALHQEELVHHEWTGFSDLTLTSRGPGDLTLYLDHQYQWSLRRDLDYYHESLAVPAGVAFEGLYRRAPRRALILGGGDGFLAERLASIFSLEDILIVDIDPRVSALARSVAPWRNAGGSILDSSRVRQVHADAYSWVLSQSEALPIDLVFLDLPDPRTAALARFFIASFFAHLKRVAPRAIVSIQASAEVRREEGARRYLCTLLRNLDEIGAAALGVEGKEQDYFVLAAWSQKPRELQRALQNPSGRSARFEKARWLDSTEKMRAWAAGTVLDSKALESCSGTPRHTLLRPGLLDL